jgi:transposase
MTKTFEAEPVLAFEPRKPGTRRRYTAEQKRMILDEAQRPGGSISAVARQFGISPSLVFQWKRQRDAGGETALAAGEAVVAESEAKMLRAKVRELERLLGKKTMEVEILKEAVEIARAKKWLPRGSSSSGDSGQ